MPDWENSYQWEEFEWEETLKYGDLLASQYFRMLDRYSDFPNVENVIAKKLGIDKLVKFDTIFEEGIEDIARDDIDAFYDDDSSSDYSFDFEDDRDDEDMEDHPIYKQGKQMVLGWGNIVALMLKEEDRFWGIKILFHLGRLFSYIILATSDRVYVQIHATNIFIKRSLYQINLILGELDKKLEEQKEYEATFGIVKKYLLESHDMLVDYLLSLKE